MEKTQRDMEKMWAKIELNSVYGIPPPSQEFRLFDPKLAEKVTKTGQEILNDLKEKTK